MLIKLNKKYDIIKREKNHTDNNEGSYNKNERNIRQRSLERVYYPMLLKNVEFGDFEPQHKAKAPQQSLCQQQRH